MTGKQESARPTDRYAVLDLFGLRLEVSSPHLAEVLTMDATEALATDLRDLTDPAGFPRIEEEMREALPDVIATPATRQDMGIERGRRALRERVEAAAADLGYAARADGIWRSPSGDRLLTRTIDRSITPAAAAYFVTEVANRTCAVTEQESVLFIVESGSAASVFEIAIRQRRLQGLMRTITITDLEKIAALARHGSLEHAHIAALLTPAGSIAVGVILGALGTHSIAVE